ACCRGEQDTGRHKANLATYTQDRRAYEHWSDGDFNQSNRLMGEYHKHAASYLCPNGCGNTAKMTADHIGPISLGFAHRPKFNALCNSCNSTKNNRMSLSDVQQLIQDEQAGEQVVSWHSKPIWDALKGLVESNQDAVKLSRLMATNMQQVLPILAEVYEQTGSEYLTRYLRPEYAFQDHRFTGFHPLEPEKLVTITKPLDSKNKQKNAERYVRISFEELERFTSKTNRRVKSSTSDEVEREVTEVVAAVKAGLNEKADSHLLRALTILAEQAKHSW
ncbi:restriction endonuclease, partial [Hymenobacter gummosus]